MYYHNNFLGLKLTMYIGFICIFSITFSTACAQEIQKNNASQTKARQAEQAQTHITPVGNPTHSVTLGVITEQRAYLESLRLDVAIQEQRNKFEELLAPQPIAVPTQTTQNLIDALEVPGQTSSGNSNNSSSTSQGSQLLSVHGVDEGNFIANIRLNGKSVSLKQGQIYRGNRVNITREQVSFGKTVLSLE